ncbi:hypothetical protein K0M31_009232 [Melipona bicolor]|uniref:Uncharacterized protein n=1 Tax=Melipona bicolor TaxID=60889 RepID=A0AA40FQ53_9HYME|nr:hypothetical protein K0M31_009232 [Melipona bicolor]
MSASRLSEKSSATRLSKKVRTNDILARNSERSDKGKGQPWPSLADQERSVLFVQSQLAQNTTPRSPRW